MKAGAVRVIGSRGQGQAWSRGASRGLFLGPSLRKGASSGQNPRKEGARLRPLSDPIFPALESLTLWLPWLLSPSRCPARKLRLCEAVQLL